MLARRRFLHGMGLAAAVLAVAAVDANVPKNKVQTLAQRLAGIERRTGGRLGVTLLDGSGTVLGGQRQDERFPMCSTFKFVLTAAVLQRVDRGELSLQQRLPVRAADMLSHAPVTERHVGGTLSVAELCRATMLFSDNPAANLLFPLVGDPPGLTRFLRTLGDAQTRSDRHEPEMNRFAAGDPRDTTTPAAMAATLRTLLLGDVLRPASRQCLSEWMIDNRTGDACLRAGLPRSWKIGDKTGSNGTDTRNDIAIVWPPGRRTPLLLTAYLNGAKVDEAARDAALKAVAVAVRETLAD
ncbi:class A beta-lactamase [Xanthomonas translucens pv. translucens]|uniref:beta-lactamase n=3 Tax=Xanthomonas campestris pv. translucens TaxID=343 RepID=A0A125PVM5_XANCT|nr:class A beta-lactamase [Xanthomonas translucens]KWV13730.1 class A beta-lactamase [Xanthomonas translucens]MCT8285939.1 class A beta-lactamase [Xanthomonas translucens pv. translucens]MCT8303597.1 class A beta-lactamase [Xanthomonas translucens pv. translucens]QSQ32648.1 class A beta-lactamase [Xanthomonas translucens pv. translucens]UNT97640.1 class A beta-lactamase [Xanthomonas translucens pv. translucens]